MQNVSRQIIVVAAIIHYNSKILLVQRSLSKDDLQPGLWEFPGGKIEFGESPEDALRREIREELELEINDLELFDVTSAIFAGKIHAVMITYRCNTDNSDLVLNSGNDFRWIDCSELSNYEFAILDIPIIDKLLSGKR